MLKVLFWAEIVVAVRILFFSAPMIMMKIKGNSFSPLQIYNWFLIFLTAVCLLHFIVGIASLGEHKFCRFFHYLAAGMVLFMAVGFMHLTMYLKLEINIFYLIPVIISLFLAMIIFLLRNNPKYFHERGAV